MPITDPTRPTPPQEDTLGRFIAYADRLDDLMGARTRPSYAETCCCGATVEIGCDVPAAERKRLANYFIARHQHCAQPAAADVDLTAEAVR